MKGQKVTSSSSAEVSDHLRSVSKFSMRSSKSVSSEQKMESLIAKGLQTDLNMSVRVSLKVVSFKFTCWHSSSSLLTVYRQVRGIAV